jgi:hypothetical protein
MGLVNVKHYSAYWFSLTRLPEKGKPMHYGHKLNKTQVEKEEQKLQRRQPKT